MDSLRRLFGIMSDCMTYMNKIVLLKTVEAVLSLTEILITSLADFNTLIFLYFLYSLMKILWTDRYEPDGCIEKIVSFILICKLLNWGLFILLSPTCSTRELIQLYLSLIYSVLYAIEYQLTDDTIMRRNTKTTQRSINRSRNSPIFLEENYSGDTSETDEGEEKLSGVEDDARAQNVELVNERRVQVFEKPKSSPIVWSSLRHRKVELNLGKPTYKINYSWENTRRWKRPEKKIRQNLPENQKGSTIEQSQVKKSGRILCPIPEV